ncbi:MAG: FAD-dependent oxidoreductase [Balneolaceae bacterium]|nr:FAD-dependent oxidoreductase [Balneolaceae bacterium]
MNNKTPQVSILGAGVSGITTGIVLQLLGYRTQIIAKDRTDKPLQPDDPEFASLYPSASIIPHSVFGTDIPDYFHDSQHIFELLLQEGVDGVSLNRHYEVFEYEKTVPSYLSQMKNVEHLEKNWRSDPAVPHHPETEYLEGWSFDCLFADWPIYMPQLFRWYEELGGSIELRKIQQQELPPLPSPIINCTGLAGRHLFGYNGLTKILKGHLVSIENAPPPTTSQGQTISYNYNPTAKRYADLEGNPQDVYCYPRSDGWIIGGSRLEGTVDEQGNWSGISPGKNSLQVDGVNLPAPIITLNHAILKKSYEVDLHNFTNRDVAIGYRYISTRDEGLCIERDTFRDSTVIHNYGHGGAGVTLSWGTAAEVARILAKELSPNTRKPGKNTLFKKLQKSLLQLVGNQ